MEPFKFDMPKNKYSSIKVVGVGGGGNNAVNYMYNQGIEGVDFIICNTDAQALANSPISNKVQLGVSITEGLGAGANPEVGEQAALESMDEIKTMFENNTKMVFVTAGMGGGTGTGAAPIIAKIAKEMDILTVGIVTVPFQFEGKSRLDSAEKGIEKLRENVDSLIVINNNKLRDLYGNLGYKSGFGKADEVLATAAKGIAEVITQNYTINIDLRDAKTVLSNSGTALMGSYQAEGDNRAKEAISGALDSPLLNDNKISGAKNVLLLIVSGSEEITIDEIGIINDFIQNETGNTTNIIMGIGEDISLDNSINVTIIATGFPVDEQIKTGSNTQKIYHTLRDEQSISKTLFVKDVTQDNFGISGVNNPIIKHELDLEEEEEKVEPKNIIDNKKDENEQGTISAPNFTLHTNQVEEPNLTEENSISNLSKKTLAEMEENNKESEEINNSLKPTQTTIFSLNETENNPEIIAENQPTEANIEDDTNEEKNTESTFSIEEKEAPLNKASQDPNLTNMIEERRKRLMQFNAKYEDLSKNNIEEVEKTPAFKRQGLKLDESQESNASNFYLDTEEEEPKLKSNNFFDDNVD